MASKIIFKKHYSGYRLEVTNRWFSLWDKDKGVWVLDASVISDMNIFTVGQYESVNTLSGFNNPSNWYTFNIAKKIKKRGKTKGSPVTVRAKKPRTTLV